VGHVSCFNWETVKTTPIVLYISFLLFWNVEKKFWIYILFVTFQGFFVNHAWLLCTLCIAMHAPVHRNLHLCINFFAAMHLLTWIGSHTFFQKSRNYIMSVHNLFERIQYIMENLNRCITNLNWCKTLVQFYFCSLMNWCILQLDQIFAYVSFQFMFSYK
jgi:hypothetical protein